MKAWKKWGRFRFKRPQAENSLKDLREIRQGFKEHKKALSSARSRGLSGFWKGYRLVMKKRAWVFTMYGNVAGRMKTLKASCEAHGIRLRKEKTHG